SDGSGIWVQVVNPFNLNEGVDDVRVNTTTAGDQKNPRITATPSGAFVVSWQGPDGDGNGVFYRLFDAQGQPIGPERQTNTIASGDQDSPSMSIGDDGTFTIVWRSTTPLPVPLFPNTFFADFERPAGFTEGSPIFIHGRTFSGPGSESGTGFGMGGPLPPDTPFLINASGDNVRNPAIAAKRDGDFTVVWENVDQNNVSSIVGRQFIVPLFVDGFETGDTSVWSSTVQQ
ncbi:MAG: hypothetical protein AAGD38_22255, partial [Acidobacteriota bacterium]